MKSDYVQIIRTLEYKIKADRCIGGKNCEKSIITEFGKTDIYMAVR